MNSAGNTASQYARLWHIPTHFEAFLDVSAYWFSFYIPAQSPPIPPFSPSPCPPPPHPPQNASSPISLAHSFYLLHFGLSALWRRQLNAIFFVPKPRSWTSSNNLACSRLWIFLLSAGRITTHVTLLCSLHPIFNCSCNSFSSSLVFSYREVWISCKTSP